MRLFGNVAIIGVGLIGGSIGLAIKKRGLARKVTGVFRRRSTLKKAMDRRAVDDATMSLRQGVADADLIVLAVPVQDIVPLARVAVMSAKKGAVITDAGSTKAWIVDNIDRMNPGRRGIAFVGSHPMAGSEKNSVEFAKPDLFENAPCIVTRTPRTDGRSLRKIVRFWRALGARVKVMSPKAHDKSVSLVSHLPHIVAFSLAGAVPLKELMLAAEGFKDTTRVASSDPHLWSDIFLTNRKEVARSGRIFARHYGSLLKAVAENDYAKTVRLLKSAKSKRDKLVYAK